MTSYNFTESMLGGKPIANHTNSFNHNLGEDFSKDPFRDSSSVQESLRSSNKVNNDDLLTMIDTQLESINDLDRSMRREGFMTYQNQPSDEAKEIHDKLLKDARFLHGLAEEIKNRRPEPLSPVSSPESKSRSIVSNSTIRPDDSASLIRPRGPKTNTTMYSGIRSSVARGSNHDDVVGGYEVSANDHMAELDAIQNIQKVYGLPQIFVDQRLNFLIHLHDPLQKMLTKRTDKKSTYPDPNSLEKLTRFLEKSRGKVREPKHELLYQVLRATIDIKKRRIRSNPFNLPIIEVGMSLDDQLVFMCISELYSEFKTIWFHSMKNVEPPLFSHDYVSSFQQLERPRSSQQSSINKRRTKGSSSILGSIIST